MLALRWSYAKDLFLVAVLGVTTLVAVPRHRHYHCHVSIEMAPIAVTLANPVADADVLYQHEEFQRAADALRKSNDPSLEADAQLYEQLAHAWFRAFKDDVPPVSRFEALRYARRIDLALGGRYADLLDDNLRATAPLAAAVYNREHNREGLELALNTCDALGVAVDRNDLPRITW